jgi:hypothetical protein
VVPVAHQLVRRGVLQNKAVRHQVVLEALAAIRVELRTIILALADFPAVVVVLVVAAAAQGLGYPAIAIQQEEAALPW